MSYQIHYSNTTIRWSTDSVAFKYATSLSGLGLTSSVAATIRTEFLSLLIEKIIAPLRDKGFGEVKAVDLSFRVVNMVATAALDRPVELESLPQLFPHEALYDEEIYGGRVAYFKSGTMRGRVHIFRSGKMISVGTRSTEEAGRELKLVANALKTSLKIKPKIRNIVATADLGYEVDLERISSISELRAIYEPEQFPGAIIKLPLNEDKTASILLFTSGKLVCVGLKKLEDIQEAIDGLAKYSQN